MKRWIEDGVIVLVLNVLLGLTAGASGAMPIPFWHRCMISAPWFVVWFRARDEADG